MKFVFSDAVTSHLFSAFLNFVPSLVHIYIGQLVQKKQMTKDNILINDYIYKIIS